MWTELTTAIIFHPSGDCKRACRRAFTTVFLRTTALSIFGSLAGALTAGDWRVTYPPQFPAATWLPFASAVVFQGSRRAISTP